MLNQVKIIQENFENKIKNVNDMKELEAIRNEFIGKNSELITILKSINKVPVEQRKELGSTANQLRVSITEKIDALQSKLLNDQLSKKMEQEKIDLSIPGINNKFGTMHPLNIVIEEISDIFNELGFEMVDGTEVEKDLYNFQYLNLPIGHPARDMQDTFYIDNETVMRTHCTNMTARMLSELAMKKEKDKNLAAVSYGNVYRRDDDDATHSHQFMQIDGFALGEKMSFANLKWILKYMCKRLFGNDVNIRMRPSFFPFTEPSVEVDISCFRCNSQGCALCKQSGWIEILGSGMVNEQVLTLCGLDSNEVSALAFGIGIERIAMLKFGISNIRNFYENNVEFLEQFKFYAE